MSFTVSSTSVVASAGGGCWVGAVVAEPSASASAARQARRVTEGSFELERASGGQTSTPRESSPNMSAGWKGGSDEDATQRPARRIAALDRRVGPRPQGDDLQREPRRP